MHFPQQGCASRLTNVRLFKYSDRNLIFGSGMVMIAMIHGVGALFNTESQGYVVKTNFLINGQLIQIDWNGKTVQLTIAKGKSDNSRRLTPGQSCWGEVHLNPKRDHEFHLDFPPNSYNLFYIQSFPFSLSQSVSLTCFASNRIPSHCHCCWAAVIATKFYSFESLYFNLIHVF